MKFFLFCFLLGMGGLLGYQKLNTKTKARDWIGKYESINPNFIERKYLLKQYGLKGAYFSSPKSRIINLNTDFTFTSLQVVGSDTIYYKGEWELINANPVLHFINRKYYLDQLSFSNKIYYQEKVKTCSGDTINHFAVFNKIK